MSRICIGVIYDFKEKSDVIKEQLERIVGQCNLGIFFNTFVQPFFCELPNDSIVFSIADDMIYDNCEMLLIPDGWMINDKAPEESFRDRAGRISEIMTVACDVSKGKIELFIGDCGDQMNDFILVNSSVGNFLNDICSLKLYDERMSPESYHFIFSN